MKIYAAYYVDYRWGLKGDFALSSTFGWTENYELAKLYLQSHYYWGKTDEAMPQITEFVGDDLYDIQEEINHEVDYMTYNVDLDSDTEIYIVSSIKGDVVTTNSAIMAVMDNSHDRCHSPQFIFPDSVYDILDFMCKDGIIINDTIRTAIISISNKLDTLIPNKDIDRIIYGLYNGIFKKV